MHYRGFVFVSNPTGELVEAAMEPYREQECCDDGGDGPTQGHWDWFRIGGRYDGYLVSDDEMERRSTCNGFNFAEHNQLITFNHCRVADLPSDRREVYFFVADGKWVESEELVGGDVVDVKEFTSLLDAAIARHRDHYIVVVDAHG